MKNSKKNFILMFLFASNALIHAEDLDDLPENTQEEAQEMAQENAEENAQEMDQEEDLMTVSKDYEKRRKDRSNKGTSVEAVYEDPSTEELKKAIDFEAGDLSNQSTDADLSSSSNADIQSESIENPAQSANNNILTRIGRSKSTDDVKDDLENPIQNPKTHEEMISHIFRVAPQATQSEIEMVENLFKSDDTARIFFIWSAGIFGYVKQAFIGGSKEDQDKFFAKIRRILGATKNLNKSNNKKLVIDLILDESTLKNAKTAIEKINGEFPGSIRIEIMEKLFKRFTQAAESHEKPINSGIDTPLFLDEIPLEKRFDFSFLNSLATYENKYNKGENTSDQTLLSFLKDKVIPNALAGNPAISSDVLRILLLNDQHFDWNIYSDVDSFNNAKVDQLETFILTMNKRPGVFFPSDGDNSANDIIVGYHLGKMPETKDKFKEVVQDFLKGIMSRNNQIYDVFDVYRDQISQIKYHYPETQTDAATKTVQEPQTDEATKTVKKEPKTAVEKAVYAYIERLEAYGKKAWEAENKSADGQNVAEEIIDITGPGRIQDLLQLEAARKKAWEAENKSAGGQNVAEEIIDITNSENRGKSSSNNQTFISGVDALSGTASAQTWLPGKMTRINEVIKQFIKDNIKKDEPIKDNTNNDELIKANKKKNEIEIYKSFAFLLLLDDLPFIQNTKDWKFLNTLMNAIKENWKDVIVTFIQKSDTITKFRAYRKLMNRFMNQYIKTQSALKIRKQWDDFVAALNDAAINRETFRSQFQSVIDWMDQVISSENEDQVLLKEMLKKWIKDNDESQKLSKDVDDLPSQPVLGLPESIHVEQTPISQQNTTKEEDSVSETQNTETEPSTSNENMNLQSSEDWKPNPMYIRDNVAAKALEFSKRRAEQMKKQNEEQNLISQQNTTKEEDSVSETQNTETESSFSNENMNLQYSENRDRYSYIKGVAAKFREMKKQKEEQMKNQKE